ncbi:RNAse R [Candidatus Koribacter versatilis Ellin345]|uniref:Ribonuclease R n=1 Tax=Koribacter versatilis (strain Ellin345) TaxID=204669 RepID=Q1IJI5_KORVE|nr:VacB/RNase II family 3'-5' exoribonuclease [Candidatus Koribacter versatilis]ABF42965.1 RNAse R [Candidatus Koribacter versatilis Ellin345]
MLTDQQILDHIERQAHQSANFKQLVREMRLRGPDRDQLGRRLESLVKRGKLVTAAAGRYAMVKTTRAQNLIAGKLSMHRDGYGFVMPGAAEVKSAIEGDIYIPPHAIGSAMHGDEVLAEIVATKKDGRAEGRILRTLNRAHTSVVGTFHYDKVNFVRPIDEKITQDIVIPKGMEWPPDVEREEGEKRKKRSEQDRVIGTEAKRREWTDLDNLVVNVEITEWPSPTQSPRGRVVEILGYEDDFGVDTEIMIRKHHLPHQFPAAVLSEARSFSPEIPAKEIKHRRDYRELPIVTIDGETARDFDDAVLVSHLPNGNFELQVHIADVAHYVTDESDIDLEARLRGTSVYFPDRAVPMLPLELSTDICSLRPQVERLVLSCVMEIDHQGEIVGYELNEGVIRSAERMTYTAVHGVLQGDTELRTRYAPLVKNFELMRDLASILNKKRQKRGSIDFDLPEPVIEFDENGLMKGVTRSERNEAHRLIEEFMLAANESVATYLEARKIASLYRIHEKPDPKRVYEFETLAASFGYSLGVGSLPIERVHLKADKRARHGTGRRSEPIEIPKDVHITPRMYQKLTQKLEGKPEERILSYLMLRSLRQARYSEKNEGHFALAATSYTHFTSPIRRYPDLIVHRILKQVLKEQAEKNDHGVPVGVGGAVNEVDGHSPWSKRDGHERKGKQQHEDRPPLTGPIPEEQLRQIAEESSDAERRADDAERELLEWKKIKFMQDRVGEEFTGLIVSVTKYGLFVELTDLFVEGLVPLLTLQGDHFNYHENTKQLIGERSRKTYSLGDKVRVILDRIDRMQRKLQFAVVEDEPHRAEGKHKKSR